MSAPTLISAAIYAHVNMSYVIIIIIIIRIIIIIIIIIISLFV